MHEKTAGCSHIPRRLCPLTDRTPQYFFSGLGASGFGIESSPLLSWSVTPLAFLFAFWFFSTKLLLAWSVSAPNPQRSEQKGGPFTRLSGTEAFTSLQLAKQ